jgi:signal transduction histidine kinase
MIKVATITLENEMDLVLAHKRSMKVAEKLGLTTATQTTFATAVSEISRTVIEHTDNGILEIGLEQAKQRYTLKAMVTFDGEVNFTHTDEGFYYAQKLVPEFNLTETNGSKQIEMSIGLPRSLKLDPAKVTALKKYFEGEAPLNSYEEIKQRNITLREIAVEQEEELKRSKIIDTKRLEFISTASHELKTPITVLKAYTQIAKRLPATENVRLKNILEKLDSQTTKLSNLIQQMLDVSKMENGSLQYHIEPLHFNPFFIETVNMIKMIIPDHKLHFSEYDDVRIMGDKERLEQVFSNILVNAAKYSAKDTSITIDCGVTEKFIKITVKDEGIGLSAESMKLIFEKFYRDESVKQSHTGLGMGLYITSKIIRDHGGEIWVESSIGQGSSFIFTLPVIN